MAATMPAVSDLVMVVDDDPDFRRLVGRMLVDAGLAVAGEADTAAAAIAAARELRPDVLLVDVGLPDRDGITLARELTALPWGPRVVLTSSNRDAAGPSDLRRSGASAFVPKEDLPGASLRDLLTGTG
jgi:two-component system nitrate/nitrite response regulator NarL